LRQEKVKAQGTHSLRMKTQKIYILPNNGIRLFPYGVDTNKKRNSIELVLADGKQTETYFDVEIDFEELKQVFPKKGDGKAMPPYISPFLEVMFEVIKEEKITEDNPDTKEVLADIIFKKLQKRNLSTNKVFAEYLAQAIRPSESQRIKKKQD
jgi:hypothetical protein